MALALLEPIGFDRPNLTFRVDTGTNRYFQLKLGRRVERRQGIDWVDDVITTTPLALNRQGGSMLDTAAEVAVPAPRADGRRLYAQLFSYRDRDGRAPAFSGVVAIPVGGDGLGSPDEPGRRASSGTRTVRSREPEAWGSPAAPGFPMPGLPGIPTFQVPGLPGAGLPMPGLPRYTPMGLEMIEFASSFEAPRRIACRTYAEEFTAAPAIGDLLTRVVQVATPVVLDLLRGGQTGATSAAGASGGSGSGGSTAGANAAPADAIAALVASILQAIPGLAGPPLSGQHSLNARVTAGSRFGREPDNGLSHPFIFGIDDAILGAVIGQVVQVLPALANAANQKRIAIKQADNKLMGDIVSDINRRMLMDQVLAAQRQAPAGTQNAADINALLQVLQSAQAAQPATNGAAAPAAPAPPTANPPTAAVHSLFSEPASADASSAPAAVSGSPSSKAVLTFVTAEPVLWNGQKRILFGRGEPIQLRVRFVVAEPAPKSPLAKAILRIVFKDAAGEAVLHEKLSKLKGVAANSTLSVPFDLTDLGKLPADKPIRVFAELRWPSSDGSRVLVALGSTEITLVDQRFLKERGAAIGPERELTDMNRYRAFWNKLWESPTLDAASAPRDRKKFLWELNVSGKYSVLLAPEATANGLMETKVLQAKKDADSLAERTEGRLKGGIELSVSELNKLLPLWDARAPLDPAKLAPFKTKEFAKANGSELVHTFKLKGRAGERGLFWAIPTFKLFEFTVGAADKKDDAGQIVGLSEEKVAFPLPVAIRAIGLKAKAA